MRNYLTTGESLCHVRDRDHSNRHAEMTTSSLFVKKLRPVLRSFRFQVDNFKTIIEYSASTCFHRILG